MKKEQGIYHEKKKRSWKKFLCFWACLFLAVDIIIGILFGVIGRLNFLEVILNSDYWIAVVSIDCLILAGFLAIYRIDAQNIALKGNDLEDSS